MSTEPAVHPHSAPRPAAHRQPARARCVHPSPGRALVDRPRLVAPLSERPAKLAVVVAPAGWGKSTVLAQWRRVDPRRFAVVELTPAHDDAGRLTAAIDAALHELHGAARRSVLVLDGLHAVRSDAARAALVRRADDLPDATMLVLGSRVDPDLPLGRRRAQDDVLELRADQLAMTLAETDELLRAVVAAIAPREVERLHALTGGWPAALRLAARALREDGPGARFCGDDTTVGDYVREEVLAALSADDRAFLRRAAAVDPLTGPTCDAALATRGSAGRLRRLAGQGVPLLPVDRSGLELRLNPLLREALRAELRELEPQLERRLHRRLSRWHEGEGDVGGAIEHAIGGQELARAGELLADRAPAFVTDGRLVRVEAWLARIGDDRVAEHSGLALTAALVHLASGRCDAADRWALAAQGASGSSQQRAAQVRALCARDGVDQMAADARAAVAAAPPYGAWRSFACFAEGSAHLLAGRFGDAREVLAEGARAAVFDAPLARSLCLAQLALLALERGDDDDALVLAGRARGAIERGDGTALGLQALTFAADAQAQAHAVRFDAARSSLACATRRLEAMPDAPAWYGALTAIPMARVALRLGDADQARTLLGDASRLGRRVPGAVALRPWIEDGWAQADAFAAASAAAGGSLTMAELRVLRFLPSHLSLGEIALRLRVSPNTIKSQAHAIYRKLDARSRSEAVARAAKMGLVEPQLGRTG